MSDDAEDGCRSVRFMPPGSRGDGLTAHCFLRDLGLGLGRLRDQLEVTLATDDSRAEDIAAFLGREYRFDSLDDVVARFVERCCGLLGVYGDAWYEIARTHDGRPMLVSMPPYRFSALGRLVVQHIPRAEWKRLGRPFVVLPSRSVVRFRLPASLGGSRGQRRLLRLLDSSGFGLPEFILQRDQQVAFDMSAYGAIRDLHVARATKGWGWNEGLKSSDSATDYFNVHRRLRFARSRSVVVEYVVAELNVLLARHALGATITLAEELRTKAFDDAAVSLREGRLSLMDAIKVAR